MHLHYEAHLANVADTNNRYVLHELIKKYIHRVGKMQICSC